MVEKALKDYGMLKQFAKRLEELTQRKQMEKKFCQSCQQMKPAEKMKLIVTKRKIWKCTDCIKKMSEAVYASKKPKNEAV